MLLVGILAFASTFELEDKSSTVSMALMVLGTGLFLMGIFRLFWKSKEVKMCIRDRLDRDLAGQDPAEVVQLGV